MDLASCCRPARPVPDPKKRRSVGASVFGTQNNRGYRRRHAVTDSSTASTGSMVTATPRSLSTSPSTGMHLALSELVGRCCESCSCGFSEKAGTHDGRLVRTRSLVVEGRYVTSTMTGRVTVRVPVEYQWVGAQPVDHARWTLNLL